jgi:hypothetical protein
VLGEDGGAVPNPERATWDAAQAVVAAATPDTLELVALRAAGPRGLVRVLAQLGPAGQVLEVLATDDPDASGVEVLPEARVGGTVTAGAYVPSAPFAPVPEEVAFWQFMLAAWQLGLISEEEAEAATRARVLPSAFAATFDLLPAPQAAAARIKFAGVTRMVRADPLFDLLVAGELVTAAQIDAVFRAAGGIA